MQKNANQKIAFLPFILTNFSKPFKPTVCDLQHSLDQFTAECKAAGIRIITSESVAMVLSRKPVDCPLQVRNESLTKWVQVSRGLVHEWGDYGAGDWANNQSSGSGFAFALSHHCDKKRAEPEGKALDLPLSLCSFSSLCGHEGWAMTERMRSWIQAAEMGFLRRVAGISLGDKVRGAVVSEELRVALLLLCVERSQLR